jgi:hypothetical protein
LPIIGKEIGNGGQNATKKTPKKTRELERRNRDESNERATIARRIYSLIISPQTLQTLHLKKERG